MRVDKPCIGRVFCTLLFAIFVCSGTAKATVVYDSDGSIEKLTGVNVTLNNFTTTYDVTYVAGTFESVTTSSLGMTAWWPYEAPNPTAAFLWMSAAINAIANALDAQVGTDASFTDGVANGTGNVNGLVPYDFGTVVTSTGPQGCATCIHSRGVWWTNSASLWSPDGGATFVLPTDVVTWAVFVAPATSPIPETASLWFGVVGLLVLIGVNQGTKAA